MGGELVAGALEPGGRDKRVPPAWIPLGPCGRDKRVPPI